MKIFLAFILFSASLCAQPFSFGLKVGAPVNQAFIDNGGKNLFSHDTQRLVIGPTAEVRLPFHLGIEADLLYRRYNIGGTVNHWEFPILAKYRFSGAPLVHPYVVAGPTFNHVSDPGMFLDRPRASTAGVSFGAGIEVRALLIRLSPELRYTRWKDKNISLAPSNSGLSSNQNQIEFLVGITF
jgi:Outer membrane protein beta-barrel domain